MRQTKEIVIVDDQTTLREALRNATVFESDTEMVIEARDGPKAIRLAGSHKPDLIPIAFHAYGD